MRVVAGRYGGRTIVSSDGATTRPTTDKVRQAVFNSLDAAGLIDGAIVVDLFAGSGAMGIEALSRGAAHVTFVERDRAALAALRSNVDKLGISEMTRVIPGDVHAWLPTMPAVDLVIADPPYDFGGWTALAAHVRAPLLVAEAAVEIDPTSWPQGDATDQTAGASWEAVRSRRYGRTWVTHLQRVSSAPT